MFQIKEEDKRNLLEEIAYFFKEEYDLDLGIIGRENVYDFFAENLGKTIYNQALDDAKRFYDRNFANMESDYYMLYKD